MEKVSILMAVYNAEKYLRESLDSIRVQTHPDLQVVCVDDASTDNSWDILQEYVAKDERIEAYRMAENKGQAVARNMALEHAVGEYITFLDADDWLAADALEKALEVFGNHKQTDSVLFDVRYIERNGDEHSYCWRFPKDKYASNPDGSFVCMKGYDAFIQSLSWNIHGWYITKRHIFKSIPYDDSCRHYSDDNTTRPHLRASREVRCCKGRYYYRQVEDSVTHVVGTSRMDYMKANLSMKNMLVAWHEPESVISFYENERWLIVVGSYQFYYLNRKYMTKVQRQYCLGEIMRHWLTIEVERLSFANKVKLGYCPFLCHWLPTKIGWILFRMEEEFYFFLKRIKERIAK